MEDVIKRVSVFLSHNFMISPSDTVVNRAIKCYQLLQEVEKVKISVHLSCLLRSEALVAAGILILHIHLQK